MSILRLENIKKSYGAQDVLRGADLTLNAGERLALIGKNGCGKTTLLRIALGFEKADSGSLAMLPRTSVGLLTQEPTVESERTLLDEVLWSRRDVMRVKGELRDTEEMMSKGAPDRVNGLTERYADLWSEHDRLGGSEHEPRAKATLAGLGFGLGDLDKPAGVLSGGEVSRAMLAKLLISEPDVLVLDEPTNHLDLDALWWLEEYLLTYKGAMIVVSHDRFFLDRIATRVVELDDGETASFRGNYTDYVRQKDELMAQAEEDYASRRAEAEKLQRFVQKWKAGTRVGQAKDREKKLARLGSVERPKTRERGIASAITPRRQSGRNVVRLQGVCKGFGAQRLFSDLDLLVLRGDRIGIVGPNGSGKTTLLRIILGRDEPGSGSCQLGAGVEIGYLPQEIEDAAPQESVLDKLLGCPEMTPHEARTLLGRFLFSGDDVEKLVSVLSGGEQRKAVLAQLVAQRPNLLVLDEPTNHFDLASREALESALSSFWGTIIFVSHDRTLLNALATKIVEIEDGRATIFAGGFAEYWEEKKETKRPVGRVTAPKRKARAIRQRRPTAARPKVKLPDLEREISKAEARLAELSRLLSTPDSYGRGGPSPAALSTEYNELSQLVEDMYREWESLSQEEAQAKNGRR
jgi:ATP-binding cassette subfamily F protein 3